MRVLAAEVLVPEIVVRVELDEMHGAVLFCDSAKERKTDGVIAADTNAANTGFVKRRNSLLDAKKGVLDGKWIHGEIAEVGDAIFGKRIYTKNRIPGTNDGGLRADIAGAEARAWPVGSAAIKGDANESDFERVWIGDVGQAHESGDAGETRVRECIKRLRMGQGIDAAWFRHSEAS